MAKWGYRVYKFQMIEGRSDLRFQEIEENRKRVFETLKLVEQDIRVGKPRLDANEDKTTQDGELEAEETLEYTQTKPTLSVRGIQQFESLGVIHARIALGELGLHDYATSIEDYNDKLIVNDRSAETPRRIDFYFATADGTGIIVSEVVGMKDAVPMLLKWMKHLSLQERRNRLKELDSKREYRDTYGNLITKTRARDEVPKTLSIRAERVADPELLQRIISSITSMDTEFIQLGENNKEVEKKLNIKVKGEARKRIANRLIGGSKKDTSYIVSQTLEDVELDADELANANVRVDTVKTHIRSEEGTVTLSPEKVSDYFNYDFAGVGRASDAVYYSTTLDKVKQITKTAGIPVPILQSDDICDLLDTED